MVVAAAAPRVRLLQAVQARWVAQGRHPQAQGHVAGCVREAYAPLRQPRVDRIHVVHPQVQVDGGSRWAARRGLRPVHRERAGARAEATQ